MLKLPRSGSKGNHKEIIGGSRKQILYVQYGGTIMCILGSKLSFVLLSVRYIQLENL